jgi:hypothetical protein
MLNRSGRQDAEPMAANLHLQEAERHIEEAEQRIARQRERVAALTRGGHHKAAAAADSILQTMIETLETLEEHRRIILRQAE